MTHSTDTEKAVLGGTLITGILPTLETSAFYHARHRRIWDALVALDKRQAPLDIIALTTELGVKGDELMYITTLSDQVPGVDHLNHHAETLRELARKRRVLEASENNIRAIKGGEDADEVLTKFDKRMAQTSKVSGLTHAREIVVDRCDFYQKLSTGDVEAGINTGYHDLDLLMPICGGDLVLVAGRPGMGKTAFAVGMGVGASRSGVSTAMFTLEMSGGQIIDRSIARIGGVDSRKMRNGKFSEADFRKIVNAAGQLNTAALYLNDDKALSSSQIRSICSTFQREENLGLVIVDHLHKMREYKSTQDRHGMYGDSAKGLKDMAGILDVPVVLLAQRNRGVENRELPIPNAADIRETGSAEEEADSVILLYRQDFYVEKQKLKPKNIDPSLVGVGLGIIDKSRHGPTGSIKLQWNAATASYRNLSRE